MGKGDGMSARASYQLPRSVALVLMLLLLALLLVVGCGGSREESQQQSAEEPVRGTFVGEALNTDAFVALIADEAKEKGGNRKVRAYLSNGTRNPLSEWFWGSVPGNELDFTSINGAQLKGILTPEAAYVTITLDNNDTSFAFSANRVNGVNGLYNVHIEDDGSFSGTRETGGERMEGRIAEGANSEGWHAVDATITPPEGEPIGFKMAASNRLSGDARLIVSGTDIVGASKRYGDRTGYISINSDLVR